MNIKEIQVPVPLRCEQEVITSDESPYATLRLSFPDADLPVFQCFMRDSDATTVAEARFNLLAGVGPHIAAKLSTRRT